MKVVLVTTTFYLKLNDPRLALAQRTIEAAEGHRYPIIVVDDSSDPAVRQAIRATRWATVCDQAEDGMGASRRQAIAAGLAWESGTADVVVWLEPEKYPLVAQLTPAIRAVHERRCELAVLRRPNFGCHPRYQARSEQLGNLALSALTGRPDLDLFFGPRVMSRDAAEVFGRYDGRYGDRWEILFVPVLQLLAEGGWRIHSIPAEFYYHPPEQTAAEEGDPTIVRKRDEQRIVLIAAMASAAQDLRFFPRLSDNGC